MKGSGSQGARPPGNLLVSFRNCAQAARPRAFLSQLVGASPARGPRRRADRWAPRWAPPGSGLTLPKSFVKKHQVGPRRAGGQVQEGSRSCIWPGPGKPGVNPDSELHPWLLLSPGSQKARSPSPAPCRGGWPTPGAPTGRGQGRGLPKAPAARGSGAHGCWTGVSP